ncbi:phosphatase PAP2 family protein [Amycolatopsis sp. NPDC054798]
MATTAGASSSETYDAITHFALAMPGWVQSLVLAYTHYGLVLVAPFFAWLWWRARPTGSPERMAAALLVPAATVVAYVLSEIVKAFVHEQRPCRGLPPEAIVGACPPPGDWSFPSNHSTIAAAVALGGAFAWRKGAPWVAAVAATMGFSRVFVGAHYPHDVLIGLALGAGMALLLQRYALAPATGLVQRFAGKVPFGLLGTVPEEPEGTTVVPEPGADRPVQDAQPVPRPDGAPVRAAGSLPPRPPQGPRPGGPAGPRDAGAPPAQPTRRVAVPEAPAAGQSPRRVAPQEGPAAQPARRTSSFETPAAGQSTRRVNSPETPDASGRPARPRPDSPPPRAAGSPPRRQNSQPIRTAAPQPRAEAPAPRRQNSQPMRTAEPQPGAADTPPPSPARPPAQPPARPARPQQPRPAGPPQGRTAGSPPPRPSNQAPAGPPPEVSPADRPSRRTPGASRPTPPGRRNARRNA